MNKVVFDAERRVSACYASSYIVVIACLGLAIVSLAVCEGQESDGEEASQNLTSGGVPSPSFRSSSELLLSKVDDIVVDSRGEVYVYDRDAGLLLLSSSGELVRQVGAEGRGPGEYVGISNLQLLPGDSLLVFDWDLNRVTVFPPGSEEAAYSISVRSGSNGMPIWVTRVPAKSSYLAAYREPFMASDPSSDLEPKPIIISSLGQDGSVEKDSVLVFPTSRPLLLRQGGSITIRGNPFARESVYRMGSDGRLFYGWSDTLGIAIYSAAGERVGGFSASLKPAEVTQQDMDMILAAVEEGPPGAPWPAEMNRAFAEALREAVPETWPVFETFLVDEQGLVWVDTTVRSEADEQWRVFADTGRPIGSATLPQGFEGMVVRNGTIYGVMKDDLDVPSVLGFKVELSPHDTADADKM